MIIVLILKKYRLQAYYYSGEICKFYAEEKTFNIYLNIGFSYDQVSRDLVRTVGIIDSSIFGGRIAKIFKKNYNSKVPTINWIKFLVYILYIGCYNIFNLTFLQHFSVLFPEYIGMFKQYLFT